MNYTPRRSCSDQTAVVGLEELLENKHPRKLMLGEILLGKLRGVSGYMEEGTITTPFDMTVLNDMDRYHLAQDMVDRVPQMGSKGDYLKQMVQDKLVEHKEYIGKYGQDMPEIRDWKWTPQ